MISSNRLKHIVRILLGALLGVYAGLIVLLNIPYVQKRLSAAVAGALGDALGTEVTIGRVDVGLLNRVIVEDMLVRDRAGEELLKVARLSAKYDVLPLFRGQVSVGSVQLFGFAVNLNRETPEAAPNYQFVVDALSPKDTADTPFALDLRVNSVLVRRGRVAYHVRSEEETPGRFNPRHLVVSDLAATLSLKALRSDTLNAYVRRVSFDEASGFSLGRLSVRVTANHKRMDISRFGLELKNTVLRADSLTVEYDSLPDLARWGDNVTCVGAMEATVVLKDAAPFVPALSRFAEPVDVRAAFSGRGTDLHVPLLRLSSRRGLSAEAEADLGGWDAGLDMRVHAALSDLTISQEGLDMLLANLAGRPSPVLRRLEHVRLSAVADGRLHDLSIGGLLRTGAGTVEADLLMNLDKETLARTYSGSLGGREVGLGRLLGREDELGDIDFRVELEGFKYKDSYPETRVRGEISSLDYRGYRYGDITLDGACKDGGWTGRLALDDPNGAVRVDGSFNAVADVPEYNVRAVVDGFRPGALRLSDAYGEADLSFSLTADFTGSSVDDMDGFISVDSLRLNDPEEGAYTMDRLTVSAGRAGGEKELRVASPSLSAVVRGDYSYRAVPSSVVQTMGRYIPSLVPAKGGGGGRTHNRFRFGVRLEDGEMLRRLLRVPVELYMPATLEGYFDDDGDRLRVEGHFPDARYGGTRYDSGVLLCETPAGRFCCSLRGGVLLKSGATLNFSARAEAADDRVAASVDWGNNTGATYGGRLAARARFSRTEGARPLLRAEVDVLPTEVVLNDTAWAVRASRVAVDSGRVAVDGFLVERGSGEYLRVDGRLGPREADSCRVRLKDIRLDYVLDIVQFDDVSFGGLATGDVTLRSVLGEPGAEARLGVSRFSLNGAPLGEARIRAAWDGGLGGVRLAARMAGEGRSTTEVDGYVSPRRKGLDLLIRAGGTDVGFLQPFLTDILSDVRGRAWGDVRLFGDFKHLDLEGRVLARMDARVDVLGVPFSVPGDSVVLSPGRIDFPGVRLADREGHRGVLDGYLLHTHLKDLRYRLGVRADNLLAYHSEEAAGVPFYGHVYVSGEATLSGGGNAMAVDATLATGPGTSFSYVTGLAPEAEGGRFITFVDRTPRRAADRVRARLYHHSDGREEAEDDGPPMDLNIRMRVEATPDAEMRVVMDPVAGDDITAAGRGDLRVDYFNKGDFRMFGTYTIERGVYKLSMQEVIRKDFVLRPGGTVSFSGDPYEAELDVQAAYTVSSASLDDLVPDPTRGPGTVRVNCLVNLAGALSDPDIRFDLELPTVKEEDRVLVRNATATEEQMNTQVIYLLGVGKFYPYDYAASGQSSNATSSLAFSTLSGQLNNLLSQWVDSKDWSIGANLSTGEKGWTDVEAEAVLSGRLLDNRLQFNGSFGYKENVLANSSFVGDFEAVWLLTRDGTWRLKGYNQTNDRYFSKSTLTTQGIGVIYKRDFDRWSELFRWFLRRRARRASGGGENP